MKMTLNIDDRIGLSVVLYQHDIICICKYVDT